MIIAGSYTSEVIINSSIKGGIISLLFMIFPIIVYYAYSKKAGQIITTSSISLILIVACILEVIFTCWPYIVYPFVFFSSIMSLLTLFIVKSGLSNIKKVLFTCAIILAIYMNSRVITDLRKSLTENKVERLNIKN